MILIKISHLVRKGWWALILLGIAVVYCYRRLMRREEFRHRQDRLLLRLPLVGALWQRLILSRFAKVLGLLLVSGVPVIRAMDITSAVVVNREYRAFLARVREELIEGKSLSASLEKSPLFPPLLVHMIAVGERSGELEKMLVRAGDAFEKEFEVVDNPVDGPSGTSARAGNGGDGRLRRGGGAAPHIPVKRIGKVDSSKSCSSSVSRLTPDILLTLNIEP